MPVPGWLFIVTAALYGACLGSFGNVCIYRLPRRCLSIVRPGSRCPKCSRPIRWHENLPILSYLFLGGRCRGCGSSISLRYPLVELASALLFAITAYVLVRRSGPMIAPGEILPVLTAHCLFVWVLLVASVIDLDFRIIPDELTKPGMWIGPALSFLIPVLHAGDLPTWPLRGCFGIAGGEWAPHVQAAVGSLEGLATGAGLVYGIGLAGTWIFRKEAMGFGDVKYMGFIGAILGWKLVIVVFFLGCLYGSIAGIGIYLVTKSHYLAFGPYLSLGALTALWLRPEALWLMRDYVAILTAIVTGEPLPMGR